MEKLTELYNLSIYIYMSNKVVISFKANVRTQGLDIGVSQLQVGLIIIGERCSSYLTIQNPGSR